LICLAGCTSNTPSKKPPTKSGDHLVPLSGIKVINVAGDPLKDESDSVPGGTPKFLAEIRSESQRMLMYVNSDSCGFFATPRDSQTIDIHLISQWPDEGEGNTRYPAGPYNTSSGSGSSKAWASLACSRNAMVIEYTGPLDTAATTRGDISITRSPDRPSTSLIVVGDQHVRKMIMARSSPPIS
jgi:hypothetical protein